MNLCPHREGCIEMTENAAMLDMVGSKNSWVIPVIVPTDSSD